MPRTPLSQFKQTPAAPRDRLLDERLLPALRHLLRAYDCAQDVGRDRWEFAVELAELRRLGLTHTDCRWLMCKNWVEFARELRPREDGARRYQTMLGLSLGKRTCVMLSLAGVPTVRTLVDGLPNPPSAGDPPQAKASQPRTRPHWDNQRRELRVGSKVVKRYRLPSPNQLAILMALEEEGWPPRIDDPLTAVAGLDSKQRLHDTIKNLNRHQLHRCLRFSGDGTGQGICWEWTKDSTTSASSPRGSRRHPK